MCVHVLIVGGGINLKFLSLAHHKEKLQLYHELPVSTSILIQRDRMAQGDVMSQNM